MNEPRCPSSALDEIREREQAATKGLWIADVIPSLRDRPVVLLSDPDNDDAADLLFRADSPQATEADAEFIAHARADVPRLIKAVEAVLKLHRPQESVVRNICAAHATGPKWRKSSTLAVFRAEVDACPDCRKEDVQVCAHCDCPNDTWPCPTYAAITAALTGEEASDEQQ